jgi:superfamily II DNA or RNA helicase
MNTQEGLPPTVLTVISRSRWNGEVEAFVHEIHVPEVKFAGLVMSLFWDALGIKEGDHDGIEAFAMRPPDPGELEAELSRRLRKLSGKFSVPSENRLFFVERDGRLFKVPEMVIPAPWKDGRLIRGCQAAYDRKRRIEISKEARHHAKEGERLLGEGHFRKAVRLFRKAREDDPAYYLPVLCLGELALREGRIDEARALLEEAEELIKRPGVRAKRLVARDRVRLDEAAAALRVGAAGPPPEILSAAVPEPSPVEAPVDWQDPVFPAWMAELSAAGPAESLDRFRLRLDAHRVLTLGGFNELIAPAKSRIAIFEHQIRAVRAALRRMGGRALLADEVGLGKTIEACLALKEYLLRAMASKVLILVPPVLVEQWREELSSKFGVEADVFSQEEGVDGSFWRLARVAVASLAMARREPHKSEILSQSYDLVIVDEAHHLRRRETLAWKLVNQIKTKSLLLLTATPVQNDLDEIYNLASLLRPGQLGTPAQFSARFKERGEARKPRDPEALRALLREFMIRHTRASAAVVLPRRVARTVRVPMTEPEASAYEGLSAFVRRLGPLSARNPMFLLSLLQRMAGSDLRSVLPTLGNLEGRLEGEILAQSKSLRAAVEAAPEPSKWGALRSILAHTPGKCLVFTEFLETQSRLARLLSESGESVEVFRGGLTPSQKAEILARFEGPSRVLLSSPAGGEGVNLQFCRTLVNYDLPWNPMRIEQRIGRLHRLGQTGEVMIFNLACKGTVEDHLLRILDEKLNLFELVVGEAETILGELTEDKEFEQILMETWLEAADEKDAAERMERLGESIVREKERYLETRRLDESLFGVDYEEA